MKSAFPPAGKGMMIRTGLCGQSFAREARVVPRTVQADSDASSSLRDNIALPQANWHQIALE
jgi:hypothetical protein